MVQWGRSNARRERGNRPTIERSRVWVALVATASLLFGVFLVVSPSQADDSIRPAPSISKEDAEVTKVAATDEASEGSDESSVPAGTPVNPVSSIGSAGFATTVLAGGGPLLDAVYSLPIVPYLAVVLAVMVAVGGFAYLSRNRDEQW